MWRYEINQNEINKMCLEGKSLTSAAFSKCHHAEQRYVLSMDGGFITANCTVCNKPQSVSHDEFLRFARWLSPTCPCCSNRLSPAIGSDGSKNYGFECAPCGHFTWFSDLLPRYEQLLKLQRDRGDLNAA